MLNKIKTQRRRRDRQIYRIGSMAAGTFKLREVLDKLARAAVEVTRIKACSIRLLDNEAGELKMSSTFGLSEEYRNKGVVSKNDPVIKAAFEGHPVVVDDMRNDARVKYPRAAAKEGIVSQLTVAMIFRDKPVGVLRLYSPKPKNFNEDDIYIARLVAAQCAVAITNAKLYAKAIEGAQMAQQMRLGAAIQRRMIPNKLPQITGLDMAAIYQPCFQVGGDLYDVIQVNDHTVAVAIADVIGKGIPAALMMSMLRGTIRAYADGGYQRHTVAEIVTKLNNVAIRECRNGEFITMFIANIDVKKKTITYCNCGHEPALLFRNQKVVELAKGGMVLGIIAENEYKVQTLNLADGDTLLLYTDGLTDTVNFDNQSWGRKRLLKAAAKCFGNTTEKCLDHTADCLIRSILGYRRRFTGLAKQSDDTSVVAIKIGKNANKK
jgi:phosphoserine phosphatase RsbU/P